MGPGEDVLPAAFLFAPEEVVKCKIYENNGTIKATSTDTLLSEIKSSRDI